MSRNDRFLSLVARSVLTTGQGVRNSCHQSMSSNLLLRTFVEQEAAAMIDRIPYGGRGNGAAEDTGAEAR